MKIAWKTIPLRIPVLSLRRKPKPPTELYRAAEAMVHFLWSAKNGAWLGTENVKKADAFFSLAVRLRNAVLDGPQ